MIAWEWAVSQVWATSIEKLMEGLEIAARANAPLEVIEQRIGRPLENTREATIRDDHGANIAVIPVVGPIFSKANFFMRVSGGVSSEILAQDIRTALDDPDIQGIILKFDSPGGAVTGTAEVADQIYRARKIKPIVAHGDGDVCSGAYWLASAAGSLTVSPTAILGSIGVVQACTLKDDSKDKVRVVEYVSTYAPYKRVNPGTDEGRAKIVKTLDEIHSVFESKVALHRGFSREHVRAKFGQGGVKVGKEAVASGMADAIMTFEDCLAELSAGRTPGRARSKMGKVVPMGGREMGWRENALRAIFGGSDTEASDDGNDVAIAPPTQTFVVKERKSSGDDPEKAELKRRLAEAESNQKELKVAGILNSAVAFIDSQATANKLIPAERNELVASYAQCLLDDAGIDFTAFTVNNELRAVASDKSTGSIPTRAENFRKAMQNRAPHSLTGEKIPGNVNVVKPSADKPATVDDDEEFRAAIKKMDRHGHVKS